MKYMTCSFRHREKRQTDLWCDKRAELERIYLALYIQPQVIATSLSNSYEMKGVVIVNFTSWGYKSFEKRLLRSNTSAILSFGTSGASWAADTAERGATHHLFEGVGHAGPTRLVFHQTTRPQTPSHLWTHNTTHFTNQLVNLFKTNRMKSTIATQSTQVELTFVSFSQTTSLQSTEF